MKNWTARVEWATEDDYDEDALDVLVEHLRGHSPAVAREPVPGGVWSATVSVRANSLRRAVAVAFDLVERATGERPIGVEVLTDEVYDARMAQPTIPDLVGYAEIADYLRVSRQRARQLADAAGFPPAVVTSKAGPLRVRSQVEGWATTWERKSGRPRKARVAVASGVGHE